MKSVQFLPNRKGVMFISLQIFLMCVFMLTIVGSAAAWNTAAMKVNALIIEKSGKVRFTLIKKGTEEFQCKSNNAWLVISACSANNQVCIAAVDRMASTLVAAKLAGKGVHVQNNSCDVTEVALKP